CPELVQFHGFRSVEVLLDTPPGSPKNCPGAKGGSVQISLSRPVSFFIVKPRFCPSRVQSTPVMSSIGFWPRPLRLTSCLSAKNTVSYDQLIADLFSCKFPLLGSWIMEGGQCFLDLVPIGFKETPYLLDREHS
ncbi:unnamed protein product, partial [Brassica rapa]